MGPGTRSAQPSRSSGEGEITCHGVSLCLACRGGLLGTRGGRGRDAQSLATAEIGEQRQSPLPPLQGARPLRAPGQRLSSRRTRSWQDWILQALNTVPGLRR